MKKSLEFGTDGIRSPVSEKGISPEFALKLGIATGTTLKSSWEIVDVVIGRDTRSSGDMLVSAFSSGLNQAGANVFNVGIMPSPAVAFLTKSIGANVGVVVSASHNMFQDNGFKFFSGSGKKIPELMEKKIQDSLKLNYAIDPCKLGVQKKIQDADGRYIEFCKSCFPRNLSLRDKKIVVDAAHGAASFCAGKILSELGAEVIEIGNKPNGVNINDSVGTLFPQKLVDRVIGGSADFGIALDGDGDRLKLVDHLGRVYDGDELLYAITKLRVRTEGASAVKGVVGTLMSNLGLERAINKCGLEFRRAKVGDRHILQILEENDWYLGGETSGHILSLDMHTTGDGIVSALQVLRAIITIGDNLSDFIADLQLMPQLLTNVPLVPGKNWPTNEKFKNAQKRVLEKLGSDGRILVRASGTEPVIRVMAEAETENLAKSCVDQLVLSLQ